MTLFDNTITEVDGGFAFEGGFIAGSSTKEAVTPGGGGGDSTTSRSPGVISDTFGDVVIDPGEIVLVEAKPINDVTASVSTHLTVKERW